MPLARIITRVQQDADELANDLRGRGFKIEIVSPENVPTHPVDLEVSLEECATEDALDEAENAPQPQDVCVFIAPGALVETARPVVVVPLFSEPVVGPSIEQPRPLAEEVTVMTECEPLDDQAVAHATVQFTTASSSESLIAEQDGLELDQDPPVVVLEGETVNEPFFETLPSAVAAPVAEEFPRRLRIRIKHSDKVFWRVAVASAVLAVGGLVTLSAHRQPPLPSALESATPPVQQAPPFARAKIQDASLSSSKAPTAPHKISEPKPSAATQAAEVRPIARATRHSVAFRPKRSRPNPESDFVAADTVVRYGKPVAVPAPLASKKPGIKQYTDLK
jgi:hypothetical protein